MPKGIVSIGTFICDSAVGPRGPREPQLDGYSRPLNDLYPAFSLAH